MADRDIVGRNAGMRLDRLPFSGFHLKIFSLIGAGMFLDGAELYITGGVLGAVTKEGWSTMTLNATFVSMTFLGMVVGAWLAGIFGDRYGRRFTYQFNLAVFGIASLAAFFAPNMETLIGLRFVMGVGLGAEVVVGYATLTEFVPARIRGSMISWLAVVTNSSLLVTTFLSLWIIPNFGWRYMFLLVGIGAMIVWFLRKKMPESPRWLESKGRFAEAEAILVKIEGRHGLTNTQPAVAAPPVAASKPSSVWIVFSPAVLPRTLMGMLINVIIGFSLYGFINWLPTFFVRQGVTIAASLQWTAVMALGAPIGAIIGVLVADRLGRKPVIVASSLSAALFGILFPLVGQGYLFMFVGFLLFTSIYVLLAIGFALHIPELFQTEYRMRGTAVCSTAGRLVTAGVQYIVVFLFAWGGLGAVVGTLVSLLVILAVVIALFGIETKKLSLEQIADELPASDSPSIIAASRSSVAH
jgi:MFS transporter, putative metabolite:H+ symporter